MAEKLVRVSGGPVRGGSRPSGAAVPPITRCKACRPSVLAGARNHGMARGSAGASVSGAAGCSAPFLPSWLWEPSPECCSGRSAPLTADLWCIAPTWRAGDPTSSAAPSSSAGRRCRLNPAGGSASRVSNSRRCRCGAGTAPRTSSAFPVRSAVERRRETSNSGHNGCNTRDDILRRDLKTLWCGRSRASPRAATTPSTPTPARRSTSCVAPRRPHSIEIDHVVSQPTPGIEGARPGTRTAGLRQRPASARRQPTGQLRQGFSRRRRLAAAARTPRFRCDFVPAGRGEDSPRTVVVGLEEGDGRRLVSSCSVALLACGHDVTSAGGRGHWCQPGRPWNRSGAGRSGWACI